MLYSKFAEYALTAGLTRELAMWLSAVRVSGRHGKGKLVLDHQTIAELVELTGFTEKTVRAHIKRLLDARWANQNAYGKVYLRSMVTIMQHALGVKLDEHSEMLRYKAVLPTDAAQWRKMIQNFKPFLLSVATAGSVKARTIVLKKKQHQAKSKSSVIIAVNLSNQVRRTKQAASFEVVQKGNDVRGVEYFGPENMSLRFAARTYGKHYTTISRYKAQAKKNGWLDYQHRFHTVTTFKCDGFNEELSMLAAETSVLPGFGTQRTTLVKSPNAGYINLVVQLTDELIPKVKIKRSRGSYYAG